MKERVFTFLLIHHVAGLHVKELVMQEEGPHIWWRHLELLMVFGDVSSSLACCTPGSNVTTGERSMWARVVAKWVCAMGLDSAFVRNVGFAEVAANCAALVIFSQQGFERFNEPGPVLFGGPPVNWHISRICCVQFTQVKWREIIFVVWNVVRVS